MVRRGENRQGLRGMRRHVESYVLRKEVSLLREEELRSSGDLGLMTSESPGLISKPVLSTFSSGEIFHLGMLQRREGKEGT